MTDPFDPYHKWLGIPPAEQPPDLYRLLGVPRFEADADVIANAADQRMAHLRTFQTGHNAALSQQLLNQLAAARVVLLHPQKRSQYDAQLRVELQSEAAQPGRRTPVSGQGLKYGAPPAHGYDARVPGPPPMDGRAARAFRPGQGARPVQRGTARGASAPDPSTSERLNALFENLSVDEQAALAHVRRSMGKSRAGPAHHSERLDPATRQRRRQLAIGGLVAASFAVCVLLLAVLLASHEVGPEAAESRDGAGMAKPEEEVELPSGGPAIQPEPVDRAVLILRWPESERTGARLSIDGARATPSSSSPAHLEFSLPTGNHHVLIVRDGYVPFEEKLALKPGARVDKTVTWETVVENDGTGLWAEYFNGRRCEELKLKRIDPNMHFIWGTDSPDERMPDDDFSVRWTGYLKAPFSGSYTLRAVCDDCMQVSLDGQMVLWGAWGSDGHPEVKVELTGEPQAIEIEFWEGHREAIACLNWLPPGNFVEQAIPPEAFFNEKEVAKNTPVPTSILRPAAGRELPKFVVGRPIDVLPWIDPDRHAIQGRWWFDGTSLVGGRGRAAILELPCPLPEEYEVRMTIERLDGNDALSLTMTADRQPFSVLLDGWGRRCSGVELVDGVRADRNATRRSGAVFSKNQPRDVCCTVRTSRLTAEVDSECVVDWEAEYRRCSVWREWAGERRVPFSLASWDSRFRISKLELIPLATSEDEDAIESSQASVAHGANASPRVDEDEGLNEPAKKPRSLADLLEEADQMPNGDRPGNESGTDGESATDAGNPENQLAPGKYVLSGTSVVKLTEQKPTRAKVGWDGFWVNRAPNDSWPLIGPDFNYCREFLYAHAPSRLAYALPRGVLSFTAVGYCVGSRSVRFLVMADGTPIHQSLKAGIVDIRVDLPPRTKILELLVDDIGDKGRDQSFWCMPRLHKLRIDDLDKRGTSVSLTAMVPAAVSVGSGKLWINRMERPDHPIPILYQGGGKCDEFFYAHADSEAVFDLPEGAERFAAVGYAMLSQSVMFRVIVDGKVLCESPRAGIVPVSVAIPEGAKQLVLETDSLGSGFCDHAFWCYPRVRVWQ